MEPAPQWTFIPFERADLEQTIPARFEQQVAHHAGRLAVRTAQHCLTYGELDAAANRVAQALVAQLGADAEPIACLLGTDVWLPVALLGILKAGKTFVALNPSFPPSRISYVLDDARVRLVLTSASQRAAARQVLPPQQHLLIIDELDTALSCDRPDLSIAPDRLAYITYTSGSTGQPKGVMVPHRTELHRVMTWTNTFRVSAQDRFTLLRMAPTVVFGALLNGASLHAWDVKRDGLLGLADWINQAALTLYYSGPTVLLHFLDTLPEDAVLPTLRLIVLSGEPVYKRHIELYRRHSSEHCLLVNRLGSTETGPMRYYFIDKSTVVRETHVPVGYAVADKEVLLLDEAGQEVGPDSVGEIAVRSQYLASGYWRKSELTRARFWPDPQGGSAVLYLTGDLGKMAPDGCLSHLGRKDFQVKIRGHRIELLEIEEALLALDAVKAAVVVARQEAAGGQRLVAYVVPSRQPPPTVTALRRDLAEILPEFMLPAVFVFLAALPLNANQRVDRLALPEPGTLRPELDIAYHLLRTPVETELADIWAEVLQLDRVGLYDDFLELGGNSLLATRIIARVRQRFRVEVPLRVLLASPTVADMAAAIIRSRVRQADQPVPERLVAGSQALADDEAT